MDRIDYLNSGTALHLAAQNGHPRCSRILLSECIPSVPRYWRLLETEDVFQPRSDKQSIRWRSRHKEMVQLLLNLGASVSQVTVEDGTTIYLKGYYHIN
ncbi:hypothetical protein N665_0455s0017 [Sinapis alba]|nr:hypothetical protein N665_0455s0017 [Sinapis alba]